MCKVIHSSIPQFQTLAWKYSLSFNLVSTILKAYINLYWYFLKNTQNVCVLYRHVCVF